VRLEEDLEELLERDGGRVVDDLDRLGVPGLAGADLLVGRVRGVPALVADGRRGDARQPPEELLRSPEAPEGKVGGLQAVRDRTLDGSVEDLVSVDQGE